MQWGCRWSQKSSWCLIRLVGLGSSRSSSRCSICWRIRSRWSRWRSCANWRRRTNIIIVVGHIIANRNSEFTDSSSHSVSINDSFIQLKLHYCCEDCRFLKSHLFHWIKYLVVLWVRNWCRTTNKLRCACV
jgi:hypothetical protein